MKFLRSVSNCAGVIITTIFTLVPESTFDIKYGLINLLATATNSSKYNLTVIANRLICAAVVVIFVGFVLWLFSKYRRFITIKGHDYIIKVKYGDLLAEKNCKKLIHFDECFTSHVGNAPEDIKPTSLCGQFLLNNPNLNIGQLIRESGLRPANERSRFQNQTCYKSGSIIQHDDYLLMAFAPLNLDGLAHFLSVKDYLDCLFYMWEKIDKYSRQCDVCIPVLGSGLTRVGTGTGYSYTEQDYVNMIIWSYMLSPYKIKKPNQLRIICRKSDDFSLDKIRI